MVDTIKVPGDALVERDGVRMIEATGRKLDPGTYDVTALVDYGGKKLTGGELEFTVAP